MPTEAMTTDGKLCCSPAEAARCVPHGSTLLIGGFGACGTPDALVDALAERPDVGGLTVVAATGGGPNGCLERLLDSGKAEELVTTYIGGNPSIYRRRLLRRLRLQLVPQGTLAERLRCGGSGVAAFYTPVGAGTPVAEGKETRVFNGRRHQLELAIRGACAFVHASEADEVGNLRMRRSAKNFNRIMPAAADFVVAQVDAVVPVGGIDPDSVDVPGHLVHALVVTGPRQQPQQQQRPVVKDAAAVRIARRAALLLPSGACTNLGLGIPTLVADCLPPGRRPLLHSENGLLGMGPKPARLAEADADVINASGQVVTLAPGAVCLDSADSFALVNSGRVAFTLLGATQASQFGDFANWEVPGVAACGMGGAMDLSINCGTVALAMRHCDRLGRPKILASCSLPLTGAGCVRYIVTELALFGVHPSEGLTLLELAEGVTLDEVASKTACEFAVSPQLCTMPQSPAVP